MDGRFGKKLVNWIRNGVLRLQTNESHFISASIVKEIVVSCERQNGDGLCDLQAQSSHYNIGAKYEKIHTNQCM
jgi:hypothetical protein